MKYLLLAISVTLVSTALFTIPLRAAEEAPKQPQIFDLQRALEVLVPEKEQQEEEIRQTGEEIRQTGKVRYLGILEKGFKAHNRTVDFAVGHELAQGPRGETRYFFSLEDDDSLLWHQAWLNMLQNALKNNWTVYVRANSRKDLVNGWNLEVIGLYVYNPGVYNPEVYNPEVRR